MPDITAAFERCLEVLEAGAAPDMGKCLPEAIQMASKLPLHLPIWLDETEMHSYEDTESLMAQLPNNVEGWYTGKNRTIVLLTPDLVTKRMIQEAIGDADHYHVYHVTQYVLPSTDFYGYVLIKPCRFHSLQLSRISEVVTAESRIAVLNTESASLGECIRENDLQQLEFLSARWEIEQSLDKKQERLREITEVLRAMAGGVAV